MIKRIPVTIISISFMLITSCRSDDDGGCRECDTIKEATICDNEDGTVEITSRGITTTETLGAFINFELFVENYCTSTIPIPGEFSD